MLCADISIRNDMWNFQVTGNLKNIFISNRNKIISSNKKVHVEGYFWG